ncbi:YcxB family protein [Thermoflavimicrobium dichotomicum]|uniref:YcxB family protein n=1 Tax=Thermoflavimicrobium dichotomicum TaxID=46223 RepID=UPI000B892130
MSATNCKSSEFTELSWDWSAIHRLSETKKYFYLSIHKTVAIIIPKSAFSSVQEKQE